MFDVYIADEHPYLVEAPATSDIAAKAIPPRIIIHVRVPAAIVNAADTNNNY